MLGALAPGGRLVIVGAGKGPLGPLGRFAAAVIRRRFRKQNVTGFIASPPFDENLNTLRELIEAGQVQPVIDRTYPLRDVPRAMAAMEREEALGKIVITV
jgi:NADPH:quinone reductase-like Zn-dependent oxidoreductase